ncbi:replication initiator protein [Microviridae sp.]|nr:replication initiator protein [Microviridae sp.]
MPCYSPLKGYKNEETGGIVFRSQGTKETMEVACGQCLGCRLDRARMWSFRIVHEASLHQHTGGNSFVTLTYDDDRIPEDWSLRKEHFQKFMKRLRKKYPQKKIKYYHCGEYGKICRHGFDLEKQKCPLCNLGRPHYHAILFNHSFDDEYIYANQGGTDRRSSKQLEETWGHGFVDVGDVTMQSAAYTARYVMKKQTGEAAKDHYQSITPDGEIIPLQPEYSTMSNGIGLTWYQKYKGDIFPSDEVPVPGMGVFKKVPRYYDEKMRLEDEQLYTSIKHKRKEALDQQDTSGERLQSKYRVKKAQIQNLKRNL